MSKVILSDSREQKNQHVILDFSSMGIPCYTSKLFVGDYTYADNQSIVIDRKKDVIEIGCNVCGKQHERFRDECIRAKESGIKLFILIEEKIVDLDKWESPKYKSTTFINVNGKKQIKHYKGQPLSFIKGETLKKALITMSEKYNVCFMFCEKKDTAKIIVNLLERNFENVKSWTSSQIGFIE